MSSNVNESQQTKQILKYCRLSEASRTNMYLVYSVLFSTRTCLSFSSLSDIIGELYKITQQEQITYELGSYSSRTWLEYNEVI
jgi:hypothetical protein